MFRYFGIALTNENCINEEIKSALKSRNACCHLGQNILSTSLLFKYIKLTYTALQFASCFVWV